MKAYAVRRVLIRHSSVDGTAYAIVRPGRFLYCQECGRRMTASETVIRKGDRDFAACGPCVEATGAVIKDIAYGRIELGDYHR